MTVRWRKIAVAAAISIVTLSAAACGSSTSATGSATVSVVASTNVYGDIAAQVAGRLAGTRVKITSIISDPDADPHSYEANTRTQLAISRADLVIENGGGYDDFVDTMLGSAGGSAAVLNVVDLSGKKAPPGGDLNEHVWYDFPTVAKLVNRIAGALAGKDAADAATFRANAAAFTKKLTALEATEAQIKLAHAGAGVAITEPVPLYLLEACGLVNRTPAEFSHAIEAGTDVAPRVLSQTLALFTGNQVKLLAYNEQTSSVETQKVLAAAHAAHIPVIAVTETLPANTHYLAWMSGYLAAVRSALG
jgi:zinc/manganese transport system substrate-binding protein